MTSSEPTLTETQRPSNVEVIDMEMALVLRKKTPAQRLEIGFSLWRYANRMLRAHLRSQNPGWSADELNEEVARRLSNGSW